MPFSQVGLQTNAHFTLLHKTNKQNTFVDGCAKTQVLQFISFHLYLSNDKEHPILEYGVDSAKAKSISLDVLNKGNSQLVMGRRGEEKEREEKTIVKDVKKVVKEEEMAVLKEVARMEQMPEVKKSAGGLYPDLSLLTDT